MKIVIISQNCFPYISPRANRATELAKELSKQGHDVNLYALLGDLDYEKYCNDYSINFKKLGDSKYGLYNNANKRNNNIIYKIITKFGGKYLEFPKIELKRFTYNILKKENDIDLLITIAHPHTIHWGAAKYVKKNKGKIKNWIADCGDPYMLNPFVKYPSYFKYVEKKWCQLCDYITVPIDEAKDAYYPEFRDKIKVIPQGFCFEENRLPDYTPNKVPTFAFSGIFYKDLRDPIKFLDYLCTLKTDFKFIIYTNCTEHTLEVFSLNKYKAILNDNLVIHSFVPRSELLKELAKMDFLINIKNNSGVQQPSKLIDYAITNRPILEITSEFSEITIFKEFLNKDYHNARKIENIEQYDIRNVVNSFLALTNF